MKNFEDFYKKVSPFENKVLSLRRSKITSGMRPLATTSAFFMPTNARDRGECGNGNVRKGQLVDLEQLPLFINVQKNTSMNEQVMTAGETAIQRFEYQGNAITFNTGDGIMVNASEMARSFGKRVNDWLRLASTREFLKALAELRGDSKAGIPAFAENQHVTEGYGEPLQANPTDFVKVMKGSPKNGGGTWFHEDVAMEFARWLSPKFAIWTNDRIKELVTRGHTELSDADGVSSDSTPDGLRQFAERMHEQLIGIWREIAKMQEAQELSIRRYGNQQQQVSPSSSTSMTRTPRNPFSQDGNYTFTETARLLGFRNGLEFLNWAESTGILTKDCTHGGIWKRGWRMGIGFFASRPSVKGRAGYYTVVTPSGIDMLKWEVEH